MLQRLANHSPRGMTAPFPRKRGIPTTPGRRQMRIMVDAHGGSILEQLRDRHPRVAVPPGEDPGYIGRPRAGPAPSCLLGRIGGRINAERKWSVPAGRRCRWPPIEVELACGSCYQFKVTWGRGRISLNHRHCLYPTLSEPSGAVPRRGKAVSEGYLRGASIR